MGCDSDSESESLAVGAACEDGNECESGICGSLSDSTRLCTQPCMESTECPEGFVCRTGYCLPSPEEPPMSGGEEALDSAEDGDDTENMAMLPSTPTMPAPTSSVAGSTEADAVAACSALGACLNDCQAGDASCRASCRDAASEVAQRRYNDMRICVDANCVAFDGFYDQDCFYQVCTEPYEACFGPVSAPIGDGTCGEFISCLRSCDPMDELCEGQCIRRTRAESYQNYADAIECIQANCSDNFSDNDCQRQFCNDELDLCFLEGVEYGGLACGALLDCVYGCEDEIDGASCFRACVDSADREARTLLTDVRQCIFDSDCEGQEACEAACSTPVAACRADVADASSDSSDSNIGGSDSETGGSEGIPGGLDVQGGSETENGGSQNAGGAVTGGDASGAAETTDTPDTDNTETDTPDTDNTDTDNTDTDNTDTDNTDGDDVPEPDTPDSSAPSGMETIAQTGDCNEYCALMAQYCPEQYDDDSCIGRCAVFPAGLPGADTGDSLNCRLTYARNVAATGLSGLCGFAAPDSTGMCVTESNAGASASADGDEPSAGGAEEPAPAADGADETSAGGADETSAGGADEPSPAPGGADEASAGGADESAPVAGSGG